MKVLFHSNNSIKPNVLIERLHKIVIKQENGRVHFDAFAYEELKWLFLSLIDFKYDLSMTSKQELLGKALKETVIRDIQNKDEFLDLLNIIVKRHFSIPIKNYYLLSSISIKKFPIRKMKVGNCTISIYENDFPRKFVTSRNQLHKMHYNKSEKNDYSKVVVEVKSKNFKDAFEEGNRSLETLRAILCLIINPEIEISLTNVSKKPINKIRTGHFYSLHYDNGARVDDTFYWFVPNYIPAQSFVVKPKNNFDFKKELQRILRRFNKCKISHKSTLEKALTIYVDAFDESNKHFAFLKAWSALEIITNTDQNNTLIKRCAALFPKAKQDYENQILEGLRRYRNNFVHEGESEIDPLIACYQVQRYIFTLFLLFNLQYAGKFSTIDDANYFLDNLYPDLETLKLRKRLIEEAIKLKESE